jgi:hypothetical protein
MERSRASNIFAGGVETSFWERVRSLQARRDKIGRQYIKKRRLGRGGKELAKRDTMRLDESAKVRRGLVYGEEVRTESALERSLAADARKAAITTKVESFSRELGVCSCLSILKFY